MKNTHLIILFFFGIINPSLKSNNEPSPKKVNSVKKSAFSTKTAGFLALLAILGVSWCLWPKNEDKSYLPESTSTNPLKTEEEEESSVEDSEKTEDAAETENTMSRHNQAATPTSKKPSAPEKTNPVTGHAKPESLNTEESPIGSALFKKECTKNTNPQISFDLHDKSNLSDDRKLGAIAWMQILDTAGENVRNLFTDDTASALYKLDATLRFISQGLDFNDHHNLNNLSQTVYESFLDWRDNSNSEFRCDGVHVGLGGHMSQIGKKTGYGDRNVLDLINNPKANSAGNGVAMGLIGATMLAKSLEEAEALAKACAKATHPGKDAVDVCACMAHMLHHAANNPATNQSLKEKFDTMLSKTKSSFKSELSKSYTKSILNQDWKTKKLNGTRRSSLMGNYINPDQGTVTDTLETALRVINDSINKFNGDETKISSYIFDMFNTKLTKSPNYFKNVYGCSADYDTVGAYTGQIWGSLVGTSSVPSAAKKSCIDNQRVYEAAVEALKSSRK